MGGTYGWVYVEIPNASYINVKAEVDSTVSFKDFSDSIIIWVRDNDSCESAVRKYYDPPEENTKIEGLWPITNRTIYPWLTLRIPYARMVEIDYKYYVAGDYVGLSIVLGQDNVTFDPPLCLGIYGGPLHAYLAVPSRYWGRLCGLGRLDVYVDGKYLCWVRFFTYWFWMHPLFVVLWFGVAMVEVVGFWERRRVVRRK